MHVLLSLGAARAPRILATILLVGLLLPGCGGKPDLSREPSQVLLIGVEAMGWERIDPLLARGELPHLAALIRGGARAVATAPDPLQPLPLWATALTGKSLANHRMTGGLVRLPSGRLSMAPSSMRVVPHLFQIVGYAEGGGRVGAVGFPGTWPAESVNGDLVADGYTPNRWISGVEHSFEREPGLMATAPIELWDEIQPLVHTVEDLPREAASRFFTLNETEFGMLYDEPLGSLMQHENPLRDFGLTYQSDLSNVDVTLHLMQTHPLQLVGVHLALPASLQPVYWAFAYPELYLTPADSRRRFRDTVDEAYRWIDEQIGRLVAAMPENGTVIVVSDHGFGNVENPRAGEAEGAPTVVPGATNRAVLVMSGHGVRKGVDLGQVDLVDLTPTVLALLGVDFAADMEGRVLREGLEEAYLTAHPVGVTDSHDGVVDASLRYPDWGHQIPADLSGAAPRP